MITSPVPLYMAGNISSAIAYMLSHTLYHGYILACLGNIKEIQLFQQQNLISLFPILYSAKIEVSHGCTWHCMVIQIHVSVKAGG